MENDEEKVNHKQFPDFGTYGKFFVSNMYLIVVVVLAVIVVLVGIAIVKSRERAMGEAKVAQGVETDQRDVNLSYVSPTFSPMPGTPTKTLPETGSEVWAIALLFAGMTMLGIIIRKTCSRPF